MLNLDFEEEKNSRTSFSNFYSGCQTKKGQNCKFPFTYQDVTYNGCPIGESNFSILKDSTTRWPLL